MGLVIILNLRILKNLSLIFKLCDNKFKEDEEKIKNFFVTYIYIKYFSNKPKLSQVFFTDLYVSLKILKLFPVINKLSLCL